MYEKLWNAIQDARSSCCDINSVISNTDAIIYLGSVETMNTKSLPLLFLLREKIDDFDFFFDCDGRTNQI